MRAQKRDENEGDIIAFFKSKACGVEALPGGNGRPDLLVYDPRSNVLFLVEVKMPGKMLNALQKAWHAAWMPCPVYLVRSVEEAGFIIHHLRSKKP